MVAEISAVLNSIITIHRSIEANGCSHHLRLVTLGVIWRSYLEFAARKIKRVRYVTNDGRSVDVATPTIGQVSQLICSPSTSNQVHIAQPHRRWRRKNMEVPKNSSGAHAMLFVRIYT